AVTILDVSVCYVSGTGLACHRKWHVFECRPSRTFCYHRFHALPCGENYIFVSYLALENFRFEFFHYNTVLSYAINQIWFHHFTIVGDCIVKCQCLQWTYHERVAKTHREHVAKSAVTLLQRSKHGPRNI